MIGMFQPPIKCICGDTEFHQYTGSIGQFRCKKCGTSHDMTKDVIITNLEAMAEDFIRARGTRDYLTVLVVDVDRHIENGGWQLVQLAIGSPQIQSSVRSPRLDINFHTLDHLYEQLVKLFPYSIFIRLNLPRS
jgi:hypothetical protein